ncbi:MAG: hypothetical protein GY711_23660 [bacterium]|nr:hypothetical protein [bacterium]
MDTHEHRAGRGGWTPGGPRRACLRFAPRLFPYLYRADDVELGALGEALAARHLASRGWRVAGCRVRTRTGEIDLVCDVLGTRICVEVKTARGPRRSSRWTPGERLDARRLARQRGAARLLGGERIDLFEVWIGPRGRAEFVHHFDLLRPLGHQRDTRGR